MWEHTKRFEGLEEADIKHISVDEFTEYEDKRMLSNGIGYSLTKKVANDFQFGHYHIAMGDNWRNYANFPIIAKIGNETII